MRFGGRRLDSRARDDRRAQLAAHRDDQVAAGQRFGDRLHLGGIVPLQLFLVSEVPDSAGHARQAEAMGVERHRLGRQPGVADGDGIGLVDAGVELLARRPEAAIDARGRDQIIDRRLDRCGSFAPRQCRRHIPSPSFLIARTISGSHPVRAQPSARRAGPPRGRSRRASRYIPRSSPRRAAADAEP